MLTGENRFKKCVVYITFVIHTAKSELTGQKSEEKRTSELQLVTRLSGNLITHLREKKILKTISFFRNIIRLFKITFHLFEIKFRLFKSKFPLFEITK